MIEITVSKNAEGIYNGLSMKGHAGYAEYGQDIVCSAVSVLVINTVNSIEQFTKDQVGINQNEETDIFEFQVISSISEETKLLLDSLLLGLKSVAEEYGREYIKILNF